MQEQFKRSNVSHDRYLVEVRRENQGTGIVVPKIVDLITFRINAGEYDGIGMDEQVHAKVLFLLISIFHRHDFVLHLATYIINLVCLQFSYTFPVCLFRHSYHCLSATRTH